MSATVSSALRWWARQHPESIAFVAGEDSITYAELEGWSSRVARHLVESDIEPGERVGILGRNSLEWVASALGVIKAGAIVIPLNNRFKTRELTGIVEDMTPSLIIGDESLAPVVAAIPSGPRFESLESNAGLRPGGIEDCRRDVDPQAPMLIMMTSGSTGRPKGVVFSNAAILGSMFEWALMEETVKPGLRIFLPAPFAFSPGMIWGLIRAVVFGGLLVFQQKWDAAEAVRLLQKHEIQISLGGPFIYEQMAQTAEFESATFPHLRTATTGGARVPVELLQKWMDKGLPIRQMFGLSEVGGFATATMIEDAWDHPDTCGYGLIFGEFKILREDGTEAPVGEQGQIIVRGPGQMIGYWNNPEQTEKTLKDGWIHTGDAGYTDSEGRLKFVDRLKDLIILGGINISPVEIEMVIGAIDGVEEVVVLPAADQKYGEVPAAVVVLRDGVTEDDILAVCRTELADYKVPRLIVVRSEPLPRLAHGKLNKVEIKLEYSDLSTDQKSAQRVGQRVSG